MESCWHCPSCCPTLSLTTEYTHLNFSNKSPTPRNLTLNGVTTKMSECLKMISPWSWIPWRLSPNFFPLDPWAVWLFSLSSDSVRHFLYFQKIPFFFLISEDQVLWLSVKEPWHSHQIQGLQSQAELSFPTSSYSILSPCPRLELSTEFK